MVNGELQQRSAKIFGYWADTEKIQMVGFSERSVVFHDFTDVIVRLLE
jgi:hypothetical protein